MQQEYGEAAAGNAAEAAAIQDPELAQLAAASSSAVQPTPAAVSQPAAAMAPPLPAPIAAAARRMAVQPAGAAASAAAAPASNGMLERRLMPTGAGITSGTLQQQQQQQAVVKKRAQATAITSTSDTLAVKRSAVAAAGQQQQHVQPVKGRSVTSSWPLACPPAVRVLQTEVMTVPIVLVLTATNSVNGSHVADVALCTTHTNQPEYIWRDKVQGQVRCITVLIAMLVDVLHDTVSLHDFLLNAQMTKSWHRFLNSCGHAVVQIMNGPHVLFAHCVMQVVAIAGSPMFAAAATANGMLHVWRPGGNLLLPPVALGCPAVSLTADGDWGLQIVGADGGFHLLDFLSVCTTCNSCAYTVLR